MNTYEFLNLLELNTDANGMPRDGDNSLLFFTNQAISLLGHSPTQQNIVFDENTGRLPLLATREGVFRYEAPNNYWRIEGVLVEFGVQWSLDSSALPTTDYGIYTRTGDENKVKYVTIAGVKYIRIPYIRSHNAGDNSNAYIVFTIDPGTTEEIYRWLAYEIPTDVLSDSIPLPIAPPYDMRFLFPATLELIRGSKSGDISKAIEYITERLSVKYNRELNKGEQGEDSDTVDRGF
ncbi:MAG: hypothetical protein GY853_13835 [PVC group bacterium]|nr:hypothetical protein [PVC group bacterium]